MICICLIDTKVSVFSICLIDTKIAGGEVSYMMTRLDPGLELPQFQELTTKKWEKCTPELKIN